MNRVWRANTVYLMLQNPRYAGRFYFNRREYRKNPETGRRVYRWRPAEQWQCAVAEDLRIIDDDLWEAAQRRVRTRRHLFSKRQSATAHLLSGLLVCDACGGRLSIVAKDYYGCRNHAESGTCATDLRIHRETIEEIVIGELARHLPQWIEVLREAATRRRPTSTNGQITQSRQRLADLRKEAETVMQTIRQGHLRGRAIEEALAAYQQIWDQVEAIERDCAAGPAHQERVEIRYDESVVADFVAHLPEALRSEVRLGREFLRETLSHVRVVAQESRPRVCPVCQRQLGKLTPQHMANHGLGLKESYRNSRSWDLPGRLGW